MLFAVCYFKHYTVSSAWCLSAVAFFQVLKIQVRSAVKAHLRRLNMMRRAEVTGAHSSGIGTQARRMGDARQGVEDAGRTCLEVSGIKIFSTFSGFFYFLSAKNRCQFVTQDP